MMINNHSPFELRISGIDDAAEISLNWATHTISILDSNWAEKGVEMGTFYERLIPKPHDGLSLCRCYFDDATPEFDLGSVLAKFEDLQVLLEFSKNLTMNDKLLVHCSAGISRSTAVATGILCQHGLSPTHALNKVFSIRRAANPNTHVIALMDQILKLNDELNRALRAYQLF